MTDRPMGVPGRDPSHSWCATCAMIALEIERRLWVPDPASPLGLQSLLTHAIEHGVESGDVPGSLHGELTLAVTTTRDGGISLVIGEDPPVPELVRTLAAAAFAQVSKAPLVVSSNLYTLRY